MESAEAIQAIKTYLESGTRDSVFGDQASRIELDRLLANDSGQWWDGFYENRAKPCPFFVEHPDENLVEWVESGMVAPGRALDIGCGHGRNTTYLASRGFDVEGIDYSQTAINWAVERNQATDRSPTFRCCSIFDYGIQPGGYDLVYDSGCFHHIAPHRRGQYVELVSRALMPGGSLGLVCFSPEGGSGLSDLEVYEKRSLGGGLGYSEAALVEIWKSSFSIRKSRPMRKTGPEEALFGESFLWTMLAKR